MQLPGLFFVLFACLWSLAQPRPQYEEEKEEANKVELRNGDNCWSLLDQTSWPQVISFDEKSSTIRIHLQQTKSVPPSTPNKVKTCLKEQASQMRWFYKFTLTRSYGNESTELTTKTATVQDLLNEVLKFHYILLRGNYEVIIAKCDINSCDNATMTKSGQVPVIQNLDEVNDSWCLHNDTRGDLVQYLPVLLKSQSRLNFSFAFTPCHPVLPYEHAEISVYMSDDNDTCLDTGLQILKTKVKVQPAKLRTTNLHEAVIEYQTPKLDGNHYYCLRITSQHPFCRSNKPAPFLSDPGLTRTVVPDFCNFTSVTVYMADLPFITQWVPFCTSHFQCGWLYVTVIGTAAFLFAFILAFICNYCCCKARRASPQEASTARCNELSPSNLDTLKLTDLRPKRTWHEVHEDFYKEPPANPGKILLLYSPDSLAFKELQASFRSFLELACHCVVLDLFDEELLQAIAYDPEAWIDQLLRDDRFKVIVVCSQGAYKRHQAILKGEVLNIPNTDSLDGLFSAGLRFLQARQYDSGRLATARYEMLHLSSEDFHFEDLAAKEFSVPSHLHELFCWIHDYDPLDLLGKPWVRYHLELQLLQDALKTARMERRK